MTKHSPLILVAALCLFAGAARAESIDTAATHAFMIEADTGAVLLDKGADARMPTSSMSKTMTMYMTFDALKQGRLKLEDALPVSERAWRMEGSKMFIHVGDSVKVEDLIRGVIIQSGNDAAVALAEGISGSETAFAEAMNAKMREIGMPNSHFMNASGWPDPDHYSTPRDLATLARRIIADFPEHYHYFSEKEFTYGVSLNGKKITQQNRDPLLGRVAGADGLKTGHTDIAGYGLIGSAKRGDTRLILVVNGLESEKARQEEGVRLMEWGFRNFQKKKLVQAGQSVGTAEVFLGLAPQVSLVAAADAAFVLPVAQQSGVKMTVEYMGPLKAPIAKDAPVGKLRVEVPGQATAYVDLLAGEAVERQGFIARAKSRLAYLVSGRI